MVEIIIRNAVLTDASDILRIYAPIITDTCISFETEVPSIAEIKERIDKTTKNYPYLVCEIDNKIVGYAYGSKHRERAAYKYSTDVSVYVDSEYHRQGIGSALYQKLLNMLREQGVYTAYAGITLPNEKSIGLHKAMGFREVGIYHNVGYKLDTWLSVLWMEKPLQAYNKPISHAKRNESLHYSTGDRSEALSIMREAAQWLIDVGKPLWDVDEFVPEKFSNPVDDFVVLWNGDEDIAAVILSFEDKFMWPEIQAGTSGFIHKLSVRRRYAGQSMAVELIGHVVQICKSKGLGALRLDCDANREGLRLLYERYGFTLKEVKTIHTKRYGTISVACYELIF